LASYWFESDSSKKLKLAMILIGVAANVFIFIDAPLYCSYRSVRRSEVEVESILKSLPKLGSAETTLIVGFDSHFLGYRHAGYYLPQYFTIEYPEVPLKQGPRIFAMRDGDTRLMTELPVASYSKFILFPLPNGDIAYTKYLQEVIRKLPLQGLTRVCVDNHEFVIGPISDLPLLFPKAHLVGH
jgi:hypothetical protein